MLQRIRLLFWAVGCMLLLCSLLLYAREIHRRSGLTRTEAQLTGFLPVSHTGKVRPRVVIDVHGDLTELSCVAADTSFVQTHIGERVSVYVYNFSHPDPSYWNIYLDTGKASDLPGLAHIALPMGVFLLAALVLFLNGLLLH